LNRFNGAFVYRLGHGLLKAERGVRFPYALPASIIVNDTNVFLSFVFLKTQSENKHFKKPLNLSVVQQARTTKSHILTNLKSANTDPRLSHLLWLRPWFSHGFPIPLRNRVWEYELFGWTDTITASEA
jgi:hypothetical protein